MDPSTLPFARQYIEAILVATSVDDQLRTGNTSYSVILTTSISAPLRCTSSATRSLDVMVEAQSHFFGNAA